jgi:hypothetical protein
MTDEEWDRYMCRAWGVVMLAGAATPAAVLLGLFAFLVAVHWPLLSR